MKFKLHRFDEYTNPFYNAIFRSMRNKHTLAGTYFITSCLCGGLAMLSKEQGITSLLICLLMDISNQYQLTYNKGKFISMSKRQMILISWIIITWFE